MYTLNPEGFEAMIDSRLESRKAKMEPPKSLNFNQRPQFGSVLASSLSFNSKCSTIITVYRFAGQSCYMGGKLFWKRAKRGEDGRCARV